MRNVVLVLLSALMLAGCSLTKDFGKVRLDAMTNLSPDIYIETGDDGGGANSAFAMGYDVRVMFGPVGISSGMQFMLPGTMPFSGGALSREDADTMIGISGMIGVPIRLVDGSRMYATLAPVFDFMVFSAQRDYGVLKLSRSSMSLGLGLDFKSTILLGKRFYISPNIATTLHFSQMHMLSVNGVSSEAESNDIMVRFLPRLGFGFML